MKTPLPSPVRAIVLTAVLFATLAPHATAQPYFAQTQILAAPEVDRDFVGAVDVDGEWAVATGQPTFPLNVSASIYVYRKVTGTWSLYQTLKCPDTGVICNDFGRSVAVSGSTIAVGNGGAGGGQIIPGVIWIFEFSGATWSFTTKLNGPPGKQIGHAVALEGNYLVTAGAVVSSNASSIESAYVFTRAGAGWSQPQELLGTDRVASDSFGYSVAISGDTVCVGAPGFQSTAPGAVHIFRRSGSAWFQEGPKLAPASLASARVGLTCAIDGDTVVAATPYYVVQGQRGSGRAYIYTRSGTTWTLLQTIVPDTTLEALGQSIGIKGDGMVLGAPGTPLTPQALFLARVNGSWVERGRAQRTLTNGTLGEAVATDGATILAGGKRSSARPGTLQVFVPSPTPPPVNAPPGPPLALQASANGNTLTMSWAAPVTGGAPTSYTLVARDFPGGNVLGAVPLGNVTTFTSSAPNGMFELSVLGSNSFGNGPESTSVIVLLPGVPAPPGAPTALAASVSGTTAALTWTAPTSGGAVANYLLAAGLTPGFAVPLGVLPLPASPTSVSLPGIPTGTYYLRVLAQNAGGTSAASNEVAITVAAPAAPGAPTLNAPVVSGGTVTLSWTPGGGGAPTSYVVTALTPGGAVLGSAPVTGTSLAIPGVPAGTYLLRMVAVNSVGTSPASNTVTLVVP